MRLDFKQAEPEDANVIGAMVVALTEEITELTNTQSFDINLHQTVARCRLLLAEGKYNAYIALLENKPIAIATFNHTYTLYAGGKIGVIHEFYVSPEFRSSGVGAQLIEQIKRHAKAQNWASIELCTPPLPAFDKTLSFYQKHGLVPVGGRKMRQNLNSLKN